jgi:hypothetical protein
MNPLRHGALHLILALLVAGFVVPRRASAADGRDCWVYFGTYTARSKGIYVSRMDADGKLTDPVLAAPVTNPSIRAIISCMPPVKSTISRACTPAP